MTWLLHMHLRAYRSLSILYPVELRRDFGPEMLEAFEHDLMLESSARGSMGVVRLWSIALREIVAIGLSEFLKGSALIVSALSAAGAILAQSPLLIMTIQRAAKSGPRPGDTTPREAMLVLVIAAAVAALTSFIAVYSGKRASLISIAVGSSLRPGP